MARKQIKGEPLWDWLEAQPTEPAPQKRSAISMVEIDKTQELLESHSNRKPNYEALRNLPVCVYLRTSTERQNILAQCGQVLDFARECGASVEIVAWDYGFSGDDFFRPGWTSVKQWCRQKQRPCIVLANDHSRCSRATFREAMIEFAMLVHWGVRFFDTAGQEDLIPAVSDISTDYICNWHQSFVDAYKANFRRRYLLPPGIIRWGGVDYHRKR